MNRDTNRPRPFGRSTRGGDRSFRKSPPIPPAVRGGGLAGEPPAGGSGGGRGVIFLVVFVLVLAGVAVAAVKFGWLS